MKWFTIDAPAAWAGVLVRSVNTAAIAFLVLQTKEYLDAGRFDTPGTAADAALIAAGTLLLTTVLKFAKPA